jgi:PAS domain S-box-containing protein
MKKRVLIVDDNNTNLYMLKTLLEGEGLDVTEAKNGQEALDVAHADPPDLILSDILMPVMDGYALCREWKLDDSLKHIPFLFYTATYTGTKNEDFALSLGADRFILKPQEPDILMTMLQEVLEETYVVKQVATKPLEEEMEFFRQYNEILFRKLEKKMSDLEIANQELRILEEKYRLIFENATDVICAIDRDLNMVSVSPSVERILGYKPQDFIGRPVSDLGKILTQESFKQAIADIGVILKGNTIEATIYQFIMKDGTIKHGEVSGSPVIREGKVTGIISVARDITERKQAEEELLFRNILLHTQQEVSIDGILVVDEKARILSYNNRFVEMWGLPLKLVEDKVDEPVLQFVTAQVADPPSFSRQVQYLYEHKHETSRDELILPDGRVFDRYSAPMFGPEDQYFGRVWNFRDITARKRAEEKLVDTHKSLRKAINTTIR